MTRLSRTATRLRAATVCGIAAISMVGGAGVAAATNPGDAPPGYAGPFSYCKGSPYDSIPLGNGHAYIDVWRSAEGSGTLCAMTYDVQDGRHSMEVIIRREDWQTGWYDIGDYDRYAGAIYVGGTEIHCAYISGWVAVDGVTYDGNLGRDGKKVCS
ncbi:hypothetical protein AB0L41_48185 [Amycolatopsis mediterranei]|uniref:hypothetical protein n=1 Tax=Amycolatopsis mediterranei TaxID=33910 RepID=UPI00343446CB